MISTASCARGASFGQERARPSTRAVERQRRLKAASLLIVRHSTQATVSTLNNLIMPACDCGGGIGVFLQQPTRHGFSFPGLALRAATPSPILRREGIRCDCRWQV